MFRPLLCALALMVPVAVLADDYAGGMTRQEFLDRHARMFDQWDRNADGILSPEEHAAMHADHHGADAARQRPKRELLHPSK